MGEELFEREYKYHTQLYMCQWEESVGIYTFDELRSLMARAGQLEEIDDIDFDITSNKWSYVQYRNGKNITKTFYNLLQVVRYMQDEEDSVNWSYHKASAVCDNMSIARIN